MKTVLCNGVFDILHYGHLLYFQAAARIADNVVVSVTRNRSVNKGPHRPTNDEQHRIALIKALRYVDEALLVDSSIEALMKVKPDIFIKGSDYRNTILPEDRAYCDANGIKIVFSDTPIYSATKIIKDRMTHG